MLNLYVMLHFIIDPLADVPFDGGYSHCRAAAFQKGERIGILTDRLIIFKKSLYCRRILLKLCSGRDLRRIDEVPLTYMIFWNRVYKYVHFQFCMNICCERMYPMTCPEKTLQKKNV